MMNRNVIVSWSGGKDACMALEKLTGEGYRIVYLVTTIPKETDHTFGYGEKKALIEAQGRSLNIPIHFIDCSYKTYTEDFIEHIKYAKETYEATFIAFGDLYIQEHREWGEAVAKKAKVQSLFPLWIEKKDAKQSLFTFIQSGYQAKIIRTKDNCGLDEWLGKDISNEFAKWLENSQICPMGEAGEFHTFVYDGPLFKSRLQLSVGKVIQMETTKRLCLDDCV